MRFMILASLLLNIAVLVPVCFGIITDATWAQAAYGGQSPARGIVLAVYLVIATLSIGLLFLREPGWVAILLVLQVGYKILTPLTVGSVSNPVVVANLLIAACHMATLFVIWRSGIGAA